MSRRAISAKENNNQEKIDQCHCNEKYHILENYRSILDRKQEFISTWKIVDNNGKISFTHGIHFRKSTDVSVVRSNHICLINPWYKYIRINDDLLSIFKRNQCFKIYEIILLERLRSTSTYEYQLAIVECPCLQRLRTYCTYCQLMLTVTEQSNSLLPTRHVNHKEHQDEFDAAFQVLNDDEIKLLTTIKLANISRSSYMSKGLHDDALSETTSIVLLSDDDIESQSQNNSQLDEYVSIRISSRSSNIIQSNNAFEKLTRHNTQGTQTKLFAIFLPDSPLSEMNQSTIEESTLENRTRTCQVNTLSYIIKTNENQTEVRKDIPGIQPMDHLSAVTFLHNGNRLTEQQDITIKSSMERKYQRLTKTNSLSHPPNEELLSMSSPLKCINACDFVEVNDSWISFDQQDINRYQSRPESPNHSEIHILKYSNNNYNNEQLDNDRGNHLPSSVTSHTLKSSRLKTNIYRSITRKRRRNLNKKRICVFLQHLRRRKKSQCPSSSSSDHRISITNRHLNNSCHYKAYDHTIIARASKNSPACKQLHLLLNNHDNSLEQLLDCQLTLTKHHRSSFLHYIHTTLLNTLEKIVENDSIQMTCMNLVFFNHSLCDLVNMQRLRLIDTGKEIFLLPQCEIILKTSHDIDTAVNRLSTKLSFAHQLLIVNFHHKQSSSSGSFLFLHLAPICSIQRTGLLTNLNSSTYSVLNLIRQLSNGQLFHHKAAKRYLLNDNSLNRLLKNYLFASHQTMTVLTVKPKIH